MFFWTRDLLQLDQLGHPVTEEWRLQVQVTALKIFRECADTEIGKVDGDEDADVAIGVDSDAKIAVGRSGDGDDFQPGLFIMDMLRTQCVHKHLQLSFLMVAERFDISSYQYHKMTHHTWSGHPNPFDNVCRYVLAPAMTTVLLHPDNYDSDMYNKNNDKKNGSMLDQMHLRQDFLCLHSKIDIIPEDAVPASVNNTQPRPVSTLRPVDASRGASGALAFGPGGRSADVGPRIPLAFAREFLYEAHVPRAVPVAKTSPKLQQTLIQRWTEGGDQEGWRGVIGV